MLQNTPVFFLALAGGLAAEVLASNAEHRSRAMDRRWWLSDEVIRGVNLGNSFIIEEWMVKDHWRDMGCEGTYDEWTCVKTLGQEAANSIWDWHWDTWYDEDDIAEIASLGLNTVRVPIGFWIKEDLVYDDEYYPQGGLPYLDRLVGWAADYGLYVLIDLHGAPGSQSVLEEFTGHSVEDPQFYTDENFERAYQWLEWMVERMHTNENYRTAGTLQVVNEPVMSRVIEEDAAYMIENYYPNAQARIRAREDDLGIAQEDRVHIQYMSSAWGSGDPTTYLNDTTWVFFDDHVYHLWDTTVEQTKDGYVAAACGEYRGGHEYVVGEWSLGINSEIDNGDVFGIEGRPEQAAWYRDYFTAQAYAYERSGGWIFWNWKCDWMTGATDATFDDYRWCYQSGVANGAIPEDASTAAASSPC